MKPPQHWPQHCSHQGPHTNTLRLSPITPTGHLALQGEQFSIHTQAWGDDRAQTDAQHQGLETNSADKSVTGILPGGGETQAPVRAPCWNPTQSHTAAPHPVFQGLQVELFPDTGQRVDGLAEHCVGRRESGVRLEPRAVPRPPPPPTSGSPHSPFTLPPVTRHFMLPPAPRPGLACDRAETGGFLRSPSVAGPDYLRAHHP